MFDRFYNEFDEKFKDDEFDKKTISKVDKEELKSFFGEDYERYIIDFESDETDIKDKCNDKCLYKIIYPPLDAKRKRFDLDGDFQEFEWVPLNEESVESTITNEEQIQKVEEQLQEVSEQVYEVQEEIQEVDNEIQQLQQPTKSVKESTIDDIALDQLLDYFFETTDFSKEQKPYCKKLIK